MVHYMALLENGWKVPENTSSKTDFGQVHSLNLLVLTRKSTFYSPNCVRNTMGCYRSRSTCEQTAHKVCRVVRWGPKDRGPQSRKDGPEGVLRRARGGAHPKEQASLAFGYLCGSRRPGKLAPAPGNDAIWPYGYRKIGILTFLGLSFSIPKIAVVIGIGIHSSQGC